MKNNNLDDYAVPVTIIRILLFPVIWHYFPPIFHQSILILFSLNQIPTMSILH